MDDISKPKLWVILAAFHIDSGDKHLQHPANRSDKRQKVRVVELGQHGDV